ncbi:uncharacterized protein [Paramisgurnus dabryanus]|uniref:uncharacterized protein n=1 Tax=Paramisgurnus dabryanus TaxID=90735 RepID=UPI0031F3997E
MIEMDTERRRHRISFNSRKDKWSRRRDTWAHTNTETNPWWKVDLLKVYKVNRVVITNRDSYYYFRINGAVIRVGNFSEDFYSNPICATIVTIPSGATETFYCAGMKGRYVHVHIPGDQHILTLNEVEVYEFLAVGDATQSSTFEDWFAEKGIDGNRGLSQQFTGCTQTVSESNPWWRLDLRDVYCINSVVITSRFDCCPEEINGAEIHIGNSLENNGNNNPLCAVISGIPAGQSFIYSCGGMVGRYINVFLPGDAKILTLCEVEVYKEDTCKQRAAVKMQFSSSSDLTDVTMRDKILQQALSSGYSFGLLFFKANKSVHLLVLLYVAFTFDILIIDGHVIANFLEGKMKASVGKSREKLQGPTEMETEGDQIKRVHDYLKHPTFEPGRQSGESPANSPAKKSINESLEHRYLQWGEGTEKVPDVQYWNMVKVKIRALPMAHPRNTQSHQVYV